MTPEADRISPPPGPAGERPSVLSGQKPTGAPPDRSAGPGLGAAVPAPPVSPKRSLSPRNWRVRSRLIVLVLVPLLATVALATTRVIAQVSDAKAYGNANFLAKTAEPFNQLVDAVEDERDLTLQFQSRNVYDKANNLADDPALDRNRHAMTDAQAKSQQIADALGPDIAKILGGSYPAGVLDSVKNASSAFDSVKSLQGQVSGGYKDPAAIFAGYNDILAKFILIEGHLADGTSDGAFTSSVTALSKITTLTETISQQRGFVTGLLTRPDQPELNQTNYQMFSTLQNTADKDLADFQAAATPQMRQFFADTVTGPDVDTATDALTSIGQRLTSTTGGPPKYLKAEAAYPQLNSLLDKYKAVRGKQISVLVDQSQRLADNARNSMYLNIAVIIGIVALATLGTLIIARSLVGPLRILQATALEIAGNRLPEMVRRLRDADGTEAIEPIVPIALTTTDEVGQVARAFDEVHREAVRLATEQAMLRNNVNSMFVNLSRRSQSLVQRQLRLIDELENSEQDPDQLSSLFKLDHLATRMRRNGENLLVLAGEEPGRRWSQPVPLLDVLRAAASEVEQYERVVLRDLPVVEAAGRTVNDLVHLVAELLENATSFSAPETKVTVTGNLLNTGGVMLEIEDSGIGMTPEELDDANERLANPPVVDVAISRRMGLFVVGRLATRHGIQVRLRRSATGGITALVLVPAALLAGNLLAGDSNSNPLGVARGNEMIDTGQQPALTSTGLPRRPGATRQEPPRELPPGAGAPPARDAVPTGMGMADAGGDGDGWGDMSPSAPPYQGSTPPGLAELLAETEAMTTGQFPAVRDDGPPPMTQVDDPSRDLSRNGAFEFDPSGGAPGIGGTGAFDRPIFDTGSFDLSGTGFTAVQPPVGGSEELDPALARALDGSGTFDFRTSDLPQPPAEDRSGEFRISAGSGDMQLNFNMPGAGPNGAPPAPPAGPQSPVTPPSMTPPPVGEPVDFSRPGPHSLSNSFDDLLPDIGTPSGEYSPYSESWTSGDDDLLMPETTLTGMKPITPDMQSPYGDPEPPPMAGTGVHDLSASFIAPPPFEMPAPSYEAPSYEAPSFEAPSFEAPPYDAPSYDAPAPPYGAQPFEMPAPPFETMDSLGNTAADLTSPYAEQFPEHTAAPVPADLGASQIADPLTDPLTAPLHPAPVADAAEEYSPIFNAINSEWFRERAAQAAGAPQIELEPSSAPTAGPAAHAPSSDAPDSAPTAPRTTVPGPRHEHEPAVLADVTAPASNTGTAAAAETVASAPNAATRPDEAAPSSADRGEPQATPAQQEMGSMNDGENTTATDQWQSPGDEGWRAAEAAKKPVAAGLTPKGLPKRVPRTNLVPGSADGSGAAKATPPPIPPRSADAVRSRLASFHQGLRQGRDAAGTAENNAEDAP